MLGLAPGQRDYEFPPQGRGVVLFVLFNSLCQACREVAPGFVPVAAALAGDGPAGKQVVLVGLGLRDHPRSSLAFAREAGWGFPVLADQSGRLLEALGGPVLPAAYLVGYDPGRGPVVLAVQRGGTDKPGALAERLAEAAAAWLDR